MQGQSVIWPEQRAASTERITVLCRHAQTLYSSLDSFFESLVMYEATVSLTDITDMDQCFTSILNMHRCRVISSYQTSLSILGEQAFHFLGTTGPHHILQIIAVLTA